MFESVIDPHDVASALETVEAFISDIQNAGCVHVDEIYGPQYDEWSTVELQKWQPVADVLREMDILNKQFAMDEGPYHFVVRNPDGEWKAYDYDEQTGLGRYACQRVYSDMTYAADVLAEQDPDEHEYLTNP